MVLSTFNGEKETRARLQNLFNIGLFNGFARLRHPSSSLYNDKLFAVIVVMFIVAAKAAAVAAICSSYHGVAVCLILCHFYFNHLESVFISQKPKL